MTRTLSARRCAWRGLLLDEARHFFGKDAVKALLERMAEHGLNVFHWHLTDDQGWRLDLPGMPELVRFGAMRASSPRPGEDASSDGVPYGPFFYTARDIREIVGFAGALGIRVVPEIDLPGHVRALLAAHPELACEGAEFPREPLCTWGVCEDVQETYFTLPEGRPGDPYRYRAWVLENGWTLPADRVRAFDPFSFVPPDLSGRVLGGECCAWSESIHDRAELEYKVLGRLAAFGEALNRPF